MKKLMSVLVAFLVAAVFTFANAAQENTVRHDCMKKCAADEKKCKEDAKKDNAKKEACKKDEKNCKAKCPAK